MNLKKFKLDSYNKIINDYNEFKDIYMFFLYPLVLKLKTKNFKNYNYSIYLKLKNIKEPFPSFKDYNIIKKYTKSNLDKDIKTIIKCIFWSDYIDKSNIYAIYYIKKLLEKNKIELLYRLLTDAPTKITGGSIYEKAKKLLKNFVGSKISSKPDNTIKVTFNTNEINDELFRNFYNFFEIYNDNDDYEKKVMIHIMKIIYKQYNNEINNFSLYIEIINNFLLIKQNNNISEFTNILINKFDTINFNFTSYKNEIIQVFNNKINSLNTLEFFIQLNKILNLDFLEEKYKKYIQKIYEIVLYIKRNEFNLKVLESIDNNFFKKKKINFNYKNFYNILILFEKNKINIKDNFDYDIVFDFDNENNLLFSSIDIYKIFNDIEIEVLKKNEVIELNFQHNFLYTFFLIQKSYNIKSPSQYDNIIKTNYVNFYNFKNYLNEFFYNIIQYNINKKLSITIDFNNFYKNPKIDEENIKYVNFYILLKKYIEPMIEIYDIFLKNNKYYDVSNEMIYLTNITNLIVGYIKVMCNILENNKIINNDIMVDLRMNINSKIVKLDLDEKNLLNRDLYYLTIQQKKIEEYYFNKDKLTKELQQLKNKLEISNAEINNVKAKIEETDNINYDIIESIINKILINQIILDDKHFNLLIQKINTIILDLENKIKIIEINGFQDMHEKYYFDEYSNKKDNLLLLRSKLTEFKKTQNQIKLINDEINDEIKKKEEELNTLILPSSELQLIQEKPQQSLKLNPQELEPELEPELVTPDDLKKNLNINPVIIEEAELQKPLLKPRDQTNREYIFDSEELKENHYKICIKYLSLITNLLNDENLLNHLNITIEEKDHLNKINDRKLSLTDKQEFLFVTSIYNRLKEKIKESIDKNARVSINANIRDIENLFVKQSSLNQLNNQQKSRYITNYPKLTRGGGKLENTKLKLLIKYILSYLISSKK